MHKSGLVELEAVAAVARYGNFRAAAEELGMSASALSHAVAGLEARLGVRLFNRTTRSVSLSAAGEQFVETIMPALAEIRRAMEGVNTHRAKPMGILRLNSSVNAARQILTPIVLEYLKRYPDMTVDIVTEARLVDIVGSGFDAGIRMADSVPGDMIAVPLGGNLNFAVVASPNYFRNRPKPTVPPDLLGHRCIRARWPSGVLYRWEFERQGESYTLDVPGSLILDESGLMREAALTGAGLAYLSEWSVKDDLAAGRLIQVLAEWTPAGPGLSLYFPGRRLVPAGLRAFIDLIREVNGRRG
ncbi:LysR family transcriptional regulator [Labrys miyagiensis]|uniref:LysR family transcriptional regulator n=1 Tax=Labrys miyagiensis TaxID=346912 RepID=A0ABQ6CLM5_9HYPH|nr:LysR family transcriptional regulator [Labrys miyagiensis]GLS20659.1 LysR family transcriptional regulator [Labrys miyagiensis]